MGETVIGMDEVNRAITTSDLDEAAAEVRQEADKSSPLAQTELERANERLAKAAEAGRALRKRQVLAIDSLFPRRAVAMSKMEAFAEAQRRLGKDAFVWRVPQAARSSRYVVGVKEETVEKVVYHAAGAGPTWEAALENQLENAQRKDKEVLARMAVIEQIAEVCHEANRAWTKVADPSVPLQPHWDDAPEEMKRSSRAGVAWRLSNPDEPSSSGHDEWARGKREDGWTHGPEKSEEKKTHPALVPYDQLPAEVQKKDFLFAAIVMALGQWDAFKAPPQPPEAAEGQPVLDGNTPNDSSAVETEKAGSPASEPVPEGDRTTPVPPEAVGFRMAAHYLGLSERAWGIIANAGRGNWDAEGPEWKDAAIRWRDDYHAALGHERAIAAVQARGGA